MRPDSVTKAISLFCMMSLTSCGPPGAASLVCEPITPCSDTFCCEYANGGGSTCVILEDADQTLSLSAYCLSVCRTTADCLGDAVCAYRDPLDDACTTTVLTDNVGECFDAADVPPGALVCEE
jgi:hypothetical protein